MPHHRLMIRMTTISFAALVGCTGAPDDGGGGTKPDASVVAPGCVEDDFSPIPFSGPGYDPAVGLLDPPQAQYVASSTWIRVNPDQQQRFQELVNQIIGGLYSQPGLVGFSVGASAQCGTSRTLTVWVSMQAMFDFVAADAHSAAMGDEAAVALDAAFVHWDIGPEAFPLSWEDAVARVDAAKALRARGGAAAAPQ